MAETRGAAHSDECEKADGGVCLCACGGTRHGVRLRSGKLRKMGDVKVTKARVGGKEAARVIDQSTGRPPGGGTKRDKARAPEKPATNAKAARTPASDRPADTPDRAGDGGSGGVLASMSADDQRRIRNAVADRGPGIYASPLVGGSRSDVGRYLAEGELGRQLADRHDWRQVWRAVSQVVDEDPSVLERSPAKVKADMEARGARADEIAKRANEAVKAGDLARGADLLDEAAAIDPDRQAYGRRLAEVRDLIRKKADDKPASGGTPRLGGALAKAVQRLNGRQRQDAGLADVKKATADARLRNPAGGGDGARQPDAPDKSTAKPVIADGMGSRMFTRAQRDLLARIAAGEQVDKHPSRAALLKMRALLPDGDGVKVNPALIDMPETPNPEKATARPNAAPEATRELRATADKLATSVPGQRPIMGDKSAHDIVRQLHDDVRSGKVTPERAAERLDQIATNLYSDIGFDLVDAARKIRGDKLSPPRPDQNGTMRDAGWLDAADLRPVKERTGGWAVHSRPSAANRAGTSQHVATKAAALEWIDRAAQTRRFWVGLGPNPDAKGPTPKTPERRADPAELTIDGRETKFRPADRSTIGVPNRPQVGRDRSQAQQLGMFADLVAEKRTQLAGQGALLDAFNQVPGQDTGAKPDGGAGYNPPRLSTRAMRKVTAQEYNKITRDAFDNLTPAQQQRILADLRRIADSGDTTSGRDGMGVSYRGQADHVGTASALLRRFTEARRAPVDTSPAGRAGRIRAATSDHEVREALFRASKADMETIAQELGLYGGTSSGWKRDKWVDHLVAGAARQRGTTRT